MQLNVAKKIILLPSVATVVLLSILITTLIVQSQNEEHTAQIEFGYFPALGLIRDLDRLLETIQRNLQDAVAAEDDSALSVSDEQRDKFIELIEANEGYVLLGAEREFEALQKQFNGYYRVARSTTEMMIRGDYGERLTSGLESMRESYVAIKTELNTAKQRWVVEMQDAFNTARNSTETAATIFNIIAVGTILSIGVLIALSFFVLRSILPSLRSAVHIADSIAADKLDNDIVITADDELGNLLQALGRMQTSLVSTIGENLRIRQALDGVTANVMFGDANLKIIYMNETMTTLLGSAEGDIRTAIAGFSASDIFGRRLFHFFKGSKLDEHTLENLRSPEVAKVEFGNRTFRLIASPIIDADDVRQGTVVEWIELTEELAAEERMRQDFGRVMGSIAAGDLTQIITTEYDGARGEIKDSINETTRKLTEIVSKIQKTASTVSSGAAEIAAGNSNLSERTEQQAASLEQTAASMEEMTATVKQNAENAAEANQLAMAARDRAQTGGTVVGQAVEAMNRITTSSKQISDIIGVIDEIAFQTNLLALNASVEAARAGDQGRGFAVVASEVRNLAGRSATAAKEIKDLIQDSVNKVDEGSRLVNESGQTLQEIVDGIEQVTAIVGEIAAASQEQITGLDEVNNAITQMDELTQQNAALVEQASSASASLGEQADDMHQLIDFFTVADQVTARPQTTASAAPTTSSAEPFGERRSAKRPWSGAAKADAPAKPSANHEAKGNDNAWAEF